jgi:hydroxyethylthiazole kinase-like uncharacterized protein yjeF
MHVHSVAEMQRRDAETIQAIGIPAMVLAERAAWTAFQLLQHRRPDRIGPSRPVLVLAGSGNNGADALALARMLHLDGHAVTVAALAPRTPEAQAQTAILAHLGLQPVPLSADATSGLWPAAQAPDLVIDGLFGIGLNRPLDGWLVDLITRLNDADSPVLALDIPSGLHGDTGAPSPVAVKATWTITFGWPKAGLLTDGAADAVGELWVADIGLLPRQVNSANGDDRRLVMTPAEGQAMLTPLHRRPLDSHKGDYGRVLLIGGSPTMPGAVLLATAGALAAGPGYVTVALPDALIPHAAARFPAAMFQPLPGAGQTDVKTLLGNASVVAIGPGLGQHPASSHLVEQILADATVPVILDADGLNVAADRPEWVRQRAAPTILTPHAGEAGRWLGITAAAVQADRWGALDQLVALTGATVVLKGSRTLIGSPDGPSWVSLAGSPALARGGSGDVLTGLIAGLAAQGLSPSDAARTAVWWQGHAAEAAAAEHGMLGATWDTVIEALPAALRPAPGPLAIPGLTRLV